MTQRWTLQRDEPRAPSSEEWQAMITKERAYVLASLPSEFRLPTATSTSYERVLPQAGRYGSAVLGLDVASAVEALGPWFPQKEGALQSFLSMFAARDGERG